MAGDVDGDGRPGVGHVPPRAQIQQGEHEPAEQVAERERGQVGAGGLGGAGGASENAEHGGQLGEAKDQVVGVEPVRVQGESGPGEPDQGEEPGEPQGAGRVRIGEQRAGQLGHDQHVGEVEEQLEPGGGPALAGA